MGSLGWAVVLSLLSVTAYAAAAVAQERLAGSGHRGRSRWAAALLLTAVGAGLHVVALNFGTVAVVQALGTLTLLFALPIEVVRYRTRISAASWRDAAATLVAAFAVCGYLLGQLSYRGVGLAAPLATVSVTNPLVAAVAGVVLFGEGVRFGAAGFVTVAVAALVMSWGVVGLARRSATSSTAGAEAAGRSGR
jgi:hypothetical protein